MGTGTLEEKYRRAAKRSTTRSLTLHRHIHCVGPKPLGTIEIKVKINLYKANEL